MNDCFEIFVIKFLCCALELRGTFVHNQLLFDVTIRITILWYGAFVMQDIVTILKYVFFLQYDITRIWNHYSRAIFLMLMVLG